MAELEAIIREVEALRVKPDEVLILRIGKDLEEAGLVLVEALRDAGLEGRSLVLIGDVEMRVAERG